MLMKKMNRKQRIYYHKHKRDNAPYMLAVRPDVNVNDVRLSAMYHHNCYQKAKGNKRFFRKNSTLYKWALNYAIKHEDKDLYSVKKNSKYDFKI